MEETRYGLRVVIPVAFEQAIDRTTEALKAEGFGVLTTIDVKHTLKQKLDREFRKYVILGACNPPLVRCKASPGRLISDCVGRWRHSKSSEASTLERR